MSWLGVSTSLPEPVLSPEAALTRVAIREEATRIHRTFMPESGPSAFAVGFPSGLSFCFDPVRGGINYVWMGGYVDLSPTWAGKINAPAEIQGEVFYQERLRGPLRRGDPERLPDIQFKGYRLNQGHPEFHYILDRVFIREVVGPLPDGDGLLRHFHTDQPGEVFWLLTEEQEAAVISSPEGEWRRERLRLTADSQGQFSIIIRRKEAAP